MNRGFPMVIAALVSLTLAVIAVKAFSYFWRTGAPVVMQCSDYLRDRPDVVWVDLRDCTLDYSHIARVYTVGAGKTSADDNYVPVVRHLGDTNIVLLLKSSASESAFLNAQLDDPSPAPSADLAAKARSLMFHRRIKGLIQSVFDRDVKVNTVLTEHFTGAAANWKIVHEEDPWPIWVGYVTAPLALVAALLALWLRPRRPAPAV